MLGLGWKLILLGFLLAVPVLWAIGIVFTLVGAIFWVDEGTGASSGRRWYSTPHEHSKT